MASERKAGKVYLLGAGPGEPGLLTLRALEVLKRADVVLYDYLVNPVALRYARGDAEVVSLGQHQKGERRQSRIWTQEEINARLVELGEAGKTVVRLKSGDPTVFGRLTEELTALREAGIEYEVVPGVTAALAAGAFAGIPVTHRELASAVAFITGHETKDKPGTTLDYAALAKFPGTLVFYMGVTTAKVWAPKLIEAGKPAETPVAIVRRCSFPDQRTFTCTLGEVAERFGGGEIRPPVIVIVGEVVKLRDSLSWFEARPLFGQRILVARPEEADGDLTRLLEEQGAETILHPVIEIGPPADFQELDAAIGAAGDYGWLLFSSSNGVNGFFERMRQLRRDARALGGVKIAAVGPATARALERFGIVCDVTPPSDFRAEGLVAALGNQVKGKRCLSVRGSRGRETLAAGLVAAGAKVEEVSAYTSSDVETADSRVLEQMAAGEIDWVVVTSSAMGRSLVRLFGESLKETKLASLSSLTSATLRELGFAAAAEAGEATMEGLVEAIKSSRRGPRRAGT